MTADIELARHAKDMLAERNIATEQVSCANTLPGPSVIQVIPIHEEGTKCQTVSYS